MEVYRDAMIACMETGMGVCSHCGRHYHGENDNFDLNELSDDADGHRFFRMLYLMGANRGEE